MIQALGSAIGALDEFYDSTESGAVENILGGLIQTIGSVIQAFGIKIQVTDQQEGQFYIALGSWTQAIGADLSAIGQQLEETQELAEGIDE